MSDIFVFSVIFVLHSTVPTVIFEEIGFKRNFEIFIQSVLSLNDLPVIIQGSYMISWLSYKSTYDFLVIIL